MSCTHARPAGWPDAPLRAFHDAQEIRRAVDTMTCLLVAALFASVRVDLSVDGLHPAVVCQYPARRRALALRHLADRAARLIVRLSELLAVAGRAPPKQ
jgi:hypothetical protein